jgi:hypothetical protein
VGTKVQLLEGGEVFEPALRQPRRALVFVVGADQGAGALGGDATEIAGLDQGGGEAGAGRVDGEAEAGDPAPDDEQVAFAVHVRRR